MKKSKKFVSLLLCASMILSGFSYAFASDSAEAESTSYMQEVVELLGDNLDGEDMFDYLSYVYLGWRTTGGPWQNQVIDNFARGELTEAGYTDTGAGDSTSTAKSANDMSSATDDDYVWTTYFTDISSLTWSPEYAKLEISTESEFEGVDALIDAVNVESYSFDPTCDTYQEYYSDLYGIPDAESDDEWIDGMWDWITTKDEDGNRIYVNKDDPQAGEESKLQKRVHLAWNSCFTDDRGTDPEDAVGVTGEVVYVGTVSSKNGVYSCSEYTDLTELEGKVLLSDSSLKNTFSLAQQVGAVAVASKASLADYSVPYDEDGNIIEPFDDSARYASGAALATTKAQTESGSPIVEWQFSNNQYNALKELLEKSDKPVMAKNISIGTAYAMNDETYGGKGQAITIAEVKGSTYPEERIFLCAHVQEPGSNDNATGVATLLGMATEYKKMIDAGLIERPERTITFMWGDEMQMATYYMTSHPEEKANIVTVLDLDMTGEDTEKTGGTMRIEKTPDPSAVYNYTLDTLPWETDSYLTDSYADADGLFTRLPDSHTLWGAGSIKGMFQEGFYLNDLYMYATQNVIEHHDSEFQVDVCPYEGGSDHSRFLAQGIPALLTWHFTDYTYHTSVDTLALSSAREMENVGITSLAAALLNADVTDENEELAFEMLELVKEAALKRMADEQQNTLNHQVYAADEDNNTSYEDALANEIEVLTAWADWYDEALESVEGLLENPSDKYLKARAEAQLELELALKYDIAFAKEMIKENPQHSDVTHVPAVAATEEAEGNIEYWHCEACGKYFADEACTQEIELADTVTEKLPCTHGKAVLDESTVKEATCTEEGYTGDSICSVCGETVSGEVIPVADHDYVEGVCSACGAADPDYVVPSNPTDEKVQAIFDAHQAILDAMEAGDYAAIVTATDAFMEAYDAMLEDEAAADAFYALYEDEDAALDAMMNMVSDYIDAYVVVYFGEVYDAFIADPNAETAQAYADYYYSIFLDEDWAEMYEDVADVILAIFEDADTVYADALTYLEDEPADAEDPADVVEDVDQTKNQEDAEEGTPATGDETQVTLWMVLLLAAATGAVGLRVTRKK